MKTQRRRSVITTIRNSKYSEAKMTTKEKRKKKKKKICDNANTR